MRKLPVAGKRTNDFPIRTELERFGGVLTTVVAIETQ